MATDAPTKIVIVGANLSGLTLTHYIFKHVAPNSTKPIKLTIISPSNKLYWGVGSPRAILNKSALLDPKELMFDVIPELTKLYGKEGQKWEFFEAWARGVDFARNIVTIEKVGTNEQLQIPYDHLVIATGTRSHNTFQQPKSQSRADQLDLLPPFKPLGTTEELLNALNAWGAKIEQANTIFLAGAGATGVETAAEIKENYPKKRVIIASPGKDVLPMLQPRISVIARRMLEKLGIEVRLGVKVTTVRPAISGTGVDVILSTGETLPVDLFIPTFGQVPNTDFLPKDIVDDQGYVITTKYLNLPAYANVWAIGDVTHWPDNRKAAPVIDNMAQVLTANLKHAATGSEKATAGGPGWVEYVHDKELIIIVPIGKKGGVGQLKQWRVWSFFVWLLKARNFMLPYARNYLIGSGVAKKIIA
ncbi:hypothetical protein BDZ91DRAFT_438690 [Kalaharituber pfeilii]|nr:hypothetical protein BDZ91DRAFT_438690 [Kalaharituber pfeilii]